MRRLYSLYAGLPHHFLALCQLPHACITAGEQTETAWNTCILSIGCSFILINGGRENYSHVVKGKCLRGEMQGERETDRMRVSQQFTPAGAGETKDPIFHFAAAHRCHLTSAIKCTTVPCRRQILQSCALVLPRVIVPLLRSCISLDQLLCALKLGMHVSRNKGREQ